MGQTLVQHDDESNDPLAKGKNHGAHSPSHGGGSHQKSAKHASHGHGGGHHEEGEEGEGPWLLSYADMVTLLMCFFILFFETEKKTGKFDEPQKVLQKLKALITSTNMESESTDEPMPTQTNEKSATNLETVFALGHSAPNTLEVVLLTNSMFKPGLAELTGDGIATIEAVANNIKLMSDQGLIEVEGHTDSSPIKGSRFADNWELSAARATSIVRLLEKSGLPPTRMRASGLAHYQPLVPERDQRGFYILTNQAINRRIVIRLRLKPTQKDPTKKDPAEKDQRIQKSK